MAKKYHVQLPRTSFPMKADLPQREPALLARWATLNLSARQKEKNRGGAPAVLHDGPPYANGPIHMGHALNKVLKDMVVKFFNLEGRFSPFIPGWDCHGLPIEHQLMKEKGWTKQTVSREEFRREAARYAEHFVALQKKEFQRLGILADWDTPYKTLDPVYEAGIVRTFYDLLKSGIVYRDLKPVYWCPSCETALAEAEVEYVDKISTSLFVTFPVLSWPETAGSLTPEQVSVLVWTTTPWTLPANVALAFHPDLLYRVWEKSDGQRVLVGPVGEALTKILGDGHFLEGSVPGRALAGLQARHPLNDTVSLGVTADFVSAEEGTGIVHIAPGHGQEDYLVGRAHRLPILSPVDEAGRFTSEVRPAALVGQKVGEAHPAILALLEESHRLWASAPHSHSYPHCWRCKNPILFRATEQWFLRVDDDLRKKLIASVDEVAWVPPYGRERILGMLATRPDWCLSRQRYWGTPIPVIRCESCQKPVQSDALFDRVVALIKSRGSDAWFETPAEQLVPQDLRCCGERRFRKEEDILDVWFDSGVSWAAVLREREETRPIPRRDIMYLEGSDQHRGWFQTSLLPAVALTGEPPYGRVLTHGFVLDGEGRAMSKSQGNVIAPQELVGQWGADVLRLWVATVDYRVDVRLSPAIMDRVVDTYRKIRNTFRFLLGNLHDFVPRENAVPVSLMDPLDRAALGALARILEDVRRLYRSQEFHLVVTRLGHEFCVNLLSEYYLDVKKDVLYCDPPAAPRRRSAQTAFWIMARQLAVALSPILSFTSEEVWQSLAETGHLDPSDDASSVFLNPFPTPVEIPPGAYVPLSDFRSAKTLINDALEPARQKGLISGAGEAHVHLLIHAGHRTLLDLSEEQAAGLLGVAQISWTVTDEGEPLEVQRVEKASGQKCPRCWVWRPLEESGLCSRCAQAEAFAPPL